MPSAQGIPECLAASNRVVRQRRPIALALVLVLGAGLFSQALLRLRSSDTGFQHSNINGSHRAFSTAQEIAALYRCMIDSLRATPGVQAAANTWPTRLSEYVPKAAMHSAAHAQEEHSLVYNIVGDEYFSTLGSIPRISVSAT